MDYKLTMHYPHATLTRRDFLRWAGATAATLAVPGLALAAPRHLTPNPSTPFAPGDLAPEDWGGAGVYDAITTYIDCDGIPSTEPGFPQSFFAFRGQVMFLRSSSDNHTVVIVAGEGEQGPITGYRVFAPIGLDQPVWSRTELNISLGGGGGGAQLRYDRETGRINLFMAGFILVFPDGVERRIGLNAEILADRAPTTSKSRILHQALGSVDAVHYYTRCGTQPMEGGNTRLLGFAHLNVRADIRLPQPPALDMAFPVPFPSVTHDDDRFIITQATPPASHVSMLWDGAAAPDLDCPTQITTECATYSGLNYHIPRTLKITRANGEALTVNAAPVTNDYRIIGAIAPAGNVLNPHPCLPTVPIGATGYLMVQTVGLGQAFLPLLNRAGALKEAK